MNSSAGDTGISATSLLGVVFVTLKLMGYINWSWWWVTAPFWAPVAVLLGVLAIFAGFALLGQLLK